MSEDRMIHRELKSPTSKKQKDERDPAHKSADFPRHVIAVNLGIICLLLLLKSTGLGYLFFQSSCKCENVNDPVGNTDSPEVCTHSHLPIYTGVSQDKQIPPDTCPGKWSCCGSDCYYFSKEEKSWDESKQACEAQGSHLIKIDDEEEQRFIQQRIKYNYWVGLRRKGTTHPWLWQDGVELSRKLSFQPSTPDAKCGYIKLTNIATAACTRVFPYICEKKFTCLNN